MVSGTDRILLRLYLVLLYLYVLSPFGATFNGIINPDSQRLTFAIILISLMLWWVARWAGAWSWHRTPLDFALLLWAIAILASIAANPATLHRSLIGIWYLVLYMGTYFMLYDMLANRARIPEMLVDALLSAGLVLLFFTLTQIWMTGRWIQPVSVMGNTNALGTVLLVILPFALGRALMARSGATRTGYAIYAFLVAANLLVTLSRGAWLGMIAALATFFILLLEHIGLRSWSQLMARWRGSDVERRRLYLGGSSVVIIVLVLLISLLLNSFSIRERRADLRLDIWRSALSQFAEKPLTGRGLFTFGYHHAQFVSSPPAFPYSHAHSLPLGIAAELGFLGLSALAATIYQLFRLSRRARPILPSHDRILWISGVSALVGFAVHHLFDTTAMMPAVALVGLQTLVIVVSPTKRLVVKRRWQGLGYTLGLSILWIGFLATGWNSSEVNRHYIEALRKSNYAEEGRSPQKVDADYRAAIAGISEAIEHEPLMPVYYQQRALLWGLLATQGDIHALDLAIADLTLFLRLEPNHAPSWRNLAALYWSAGDSDNAAWSLERNMELAPDSDLSAGQPSAQDGETASQSIELPYSGYNQEFTRFHFYRESLPLTYLPQVGLDARE